MGDFIVDDENDEARADIDGSRSVEQDDSERSKYGLTDEQATQAFEMFGELYWMDDDDEMEAPVNEVDKVEQAKRYLQSFERLKLIESFCTDRDEEIKRIDRPERNLVEEYLISRTPPDDAERSREAVWISEILYSRIEARTDNDLGELRSELPETVKCVLKFLQIDQFECPFIWTYRRDYLHKLVARKDLWYIQMCDEKWETLMRRKKHAANEIAAVADAASRGGLGESDYKEEDQYVLKQRFDEAEETFDRLRLEREELKAICASKKDDYERAYTNDDDDDQSDIGSKKIAYETSLKKLDLLDIDLSEAQVAMDRVKSELDSLKKRLDFGSRFKPAAAAEVLRLFPRDVYESVIRSTYEECEIEDIQNYLNMLLSCAEIESEKVKDIEGSRRRLRKSAAVDVYNKTKQVDGVRELIESFTVTVADFAEGQRLGIKKEPPTPDVDPQTSAQRLVDGVVFKTPDGVLKSMRLVLATELAAEPCVRKSARSIYRQNVKLRSKPTEMGIECIGPFHEMFGFHLIENKTIYSLFREDRTLFLKLAKLEKEGLVKIEFEFPQSTESSGGKAGLDLTMFMSDLRFMHFFMPTLSPDLDINPKMRTAWDDQRLRVLQECIEKHLIPSLEAELRRDLLRASREAVIDEARDNFDRMVRVGPYRFSSVNTKKILKNLPLNPNVFTVAVVYVNETESKNGVSLALAYLGYEGTVKATDSISAKIKSQSKEKIKLFLKAHRPDLVVVNTSGGRASKAMFETIRRDMLEEISSMIQQEEREEHDHQRDLYGNDEMYEVTVFQPDVILAKDDLARLFKMSRRSKKMFPDFLPEISAAISLGRYVQEPLAEFCSMWQTADNTGRFGTESIHLDIHPLKSELKGLGGTLLRTLEQVLVDSVCDVGVDLSFAISYSHLAPMLAFVCGLGLRKADALLDNVKRQKHPILMRKELLERKILGPLVYTNAAGFLKIYDNDRQDPKDDPLDFTRIHPECYVTYDFARKICSEALDMENDIDQHNLIISLCKKDSRAAMKKKFVEDPEWLKLWDKGRPSELPPRRRIAVDHNEYLDDGELNDKLMALDLEGYASICEKLNKGKRHLQFLQIKEEIRFPWYDSRKPTGAMPSPEELFSIITGEDDYSLYVGMLVSCEVTKIQEYRADVMIENRIRGYVHREQMSDSLFNDISEVLSKGMQLSGVVIGVKKDKMLVEVSLKPSVVHRGEIWWMSNRSTEECMRIWWSDCRRERFDSNFNEAKALSMLDQARQQQMQNIGQGRVEKGIKRRVIYHSAFKNYTFAEAEEELRGKSAGEFLFRPSSKGTNYIAITWAFQENWFKHIDVEEMDKRPGDQGLGKKLIIDHVKDPFTDLNDIVANFIGPMNDFVSEMVGHKWFYNGDFNDVKPKLAERSANEPGSIPYYICFDKRYPGYFCIAWFAKESSEPNKKILVAVRHNVITILHFMINISY